MALFYPDILRHNNSNYAIIDNTEVRGGAQSVTDKATRNLIPLDKRTLAMLVSYKDGAANVTKRFDGLTTADVNWTSDANWSDVVPIGINYATANNAFTGNNSFAGTSIFNGATTFNSSITVPTPTLLTQAVNKQYVDGKLTTSLAELSDSIDSLALHKAGNETKSGILTIDSLSAGTSGLVLSKLPSTGTFNPLITDASGVVIKATNLQDVPYVKVADLGVTAQAQLNGTGFVKMTGTSPSYITDNSVNWNTAYGWGNHAASGYFLDANKSSIALGGELSGTTGVATLVNSAVTGKLLTGLSISGSGISATDSILSAFGKLQNQVAGLVGGSQFQSVWNASTNLPALVTGVGTKGYYYIVDVAGTTTLDGINEWAVGDWAIFDGTKWRKIDNTDAISSFNGSLGSIVYTPSGVTNRISITGAAGLAPVIDISANYAGQGTITTLGTITTGTWNSSVISPTYGGTGINNGIKTITLGGNLVTIGAFNTTVRTTAATDVTLPVSGTLVGSSDIGTVTNVMLAGSIADSKLSTITTSGKVSTTALTGTLATLGTTAIAAGSTVVTLAGLTSVTSSSFVGALTGNASTATKVNTAVTFNNSGAGDASGSTFDGSAARAISYNTIGAQKAISSTNYICGVAIPGVPDGVLKVFTLSSTPLPGTEMIFMNGVLMQRGTDYTIAGDVVTFSIGQEPEAGTNLTATYFV
jgi:hypothetical protein